MRNGQIAILVLSLCCVAWGFSFPAMQISTAAVDRAVSQDSRVPETIATKLSVRGAFNAWRFGLAGVLCAAISLNARYRRRELIGGALVGLFFGLGMLFQLWGIQYTLPSVSSFLTAIPIFAPLGQRLAFGRPVGARVWLGIVVAVVGMAILSFGNGGAVAANTLSLAPPVPFLGQVLTVAGAMFFAAQILAVDRFGQRADSSGLTTVMLLSAAAVSAAVAIACGKVGLFRVSIAVTLARDVTFGWSFVGLVLFSSVLAMTLMNAWQPRIAPATAAVVYCLEPVFGTLFSVAFGTELLTGVTLVGGAIILGAVLLIARQPKENTATVTSKPVTVAE
jgi:drug/metabolite transporter (DMT)-like permease